MTTNYDYIIAGSGCAGLSLLHGLMQQKFFGTKKILVVDKSAKEKNDRTWCFWEKEPGPFEEVVFHKWNEIDFFSQYFSSRFNIAPYQYKMIRGIDFYNYVLREAYQHSNIEFYFGNVQSVTTVAGKAVLTADDKQFTADYIFNSILFDHSVIHKASQYNSKHYYLLQHFKGWIIETPENIFEPQVATFMDFRVDQDRGTTFVYVLPVARNKALIEYTVFSKTLLMPSQYNEALQNYINTYLRTAYKIVDEEVGIIPMTNYPFSKSEGRIINIGTAGGQTKATSGFTFRFIQKHTEKIIQALMRGEDPSIKNSFITKRFGLYDNTLLNVLTYNKLNGDVIFADLFKKNPAQRVLKFLDNETNLMEELKLMSTVPSSVFLPSAFQELFK